MLNRVNIMTVTVKSMQATGGYGLVQIPAEHIAGRNSALR